MEKFRERMIAAIKPYTGFIFLALFIGIPLTVIGIGKLVVREIDNYKMHQISNQILAANTNKDISFIDEAYYHFGDYKFHLLVETKLSKDEITNYFKKVKIVPIISKERIKMEIDGPIQEIEFTDAENLAEQCGKNIKINNPSGDGKYYHIWIVEPDIPSHSD